MRLLTGMSGMIGKNLREMHPEVLAPTHSELDLCDRAQVRDYLEHTKPESIIHCASNDDEVCLFDNLRMFTNLAESGIPMKIFATGRDIEDRPGKVGEYILSKYIAQELALNKYKHILVIKIWGCFGKYEKDTRFLMDNMLRVKANLPIIVRENKLFSYVYVNDLVNIVWDVGISPHLTNIVAYTDSLYNYARVLKEVTGSPHEIIKEKLCFETSYVGKSDWTSYQFTPLKQALLEMWNAVNSYSSF